MEGFIKYNNFEIFLLIYIINLSHNNQISLNLKCKLLFILF